MTDNLEELERRYLIRKQGAWYRPNARGYTESAIQAGRYTLAEAIRHSHPNGPDGPRDGMDYVHEDDVTDPDWIAYREAIATAREVEGLRAALQKCADAMALVTEGNPMGKNDKCEHGRFGFEGCESCTDSALDPALDAARAALKGKGG